MKNKNKFFIFFQFIVTFIIVYLSTNLIFSFIRYVSRLTIWYGDEPLFFLYNFFNEYTILIVVIVYAIEFIVIANFYWNKPLRYLKEVVDATEKIYHSQEEEIKLPKELAEAEYKLNQLRLNLKENMRIAKEAEQRKNDLLVYLAHDLKTPLTSVIGYLSLLRDEEEISKPLREKYIGISLEKAERLELLINEFFEITRFNLSTLTLELSNVNLTRMLQQLVFEFEPTLSPKNLTVELAIDSEIEVKLDVNKIERVFDNLLSNAINYSYPESTINVGVRKLEETLEIVISNRGNQIPEEKLEKIFEQFYRLDVSRDPSSGGAGIGLAVSREIVELHGGTIKANSQDELTEFTIVMPLL